MATCYVVWAGRSPEDGILSVHLNRESAMVAAGALATQLSRERDVAYSADEFVYESELVVDAHRHLFLDVTTLEDAPNGVMTILCGCGEKRVVKR